MSLYAVKNDKGEWLSFDSSHESVWYTNNPTFFNDNSYAEAQAGPYGHVVELVEAPAKVVLTEKQAEIVEDARMSSIPASYISGHSNVSNGEEILLMKACVNGYTMAKEKKYNVKVPLVQAQGGLWFYINSDDKLDAIYLQELAKKFTMDEIEENGLQDCEKEEVDQDAE